MDHLPGLPIDASTYSNHGCRCTGCCAANTVRCVGYQRRTRPERIVSVPVPEPEPVSAEPELPALPEIRYEPVPRLHPDAPPPGSRKFFYLEEEDVPA